MELMDELVEEIFLRFSPEEPSHLVRSALVCRSWCRTISDRGFRRRYRAFHRNNPPLLGYFHNLYCWWPGDNDGDIPRFVHTSATAASPFSHPALDGIHRQWSVLDCRHGRVLIRTFHSRFESDTLIIWDPMTGDQEHVSVPDGTWTHSTGAVLCGNAMRGCDHLDCHGSPFTVVFLAEDEREYVFDGYIIRASTYSSETKRWRESNSVVVEGHFIDRKPSLLAGSALYFPIGEFGCVHKFDVGGHCLSEIDTSDVFEDVIVTEGENGGLRVVADMGNRIGVWTQQQQAGVNGGTTSTGSGWVRRRRDIKLEERLPPKRRRHLSCFDQFDVVRREVVGYAEGTDTVFISRDGKVYMLDLKSRKVRKTRKVGSRIREYHHHAIYPYIGFYTPDIAEGRLSPP